MRNYRSFTLPALLVGLFIQQTTLSVVYADEGKKVTFCGRSSYLAKGSAEEIFCYGGGKSGEATTMEKMYANGWRITAMSSFLDNSSIEQVRLIFVK